MFLENILKVCFLDLEKLHGHFLCVCVKLSLLINVTVKLRPTFVRVKWNIDWGKIGGVACTFQILIKDYEDKNK